MTPRAGNGAAAARQPRSRGFTYLALLLVIVIIGISLGAAGKYWQNVMRREKEEELLFRGDQYRLAIERYYSAVPGRPQYPQNIEDLLKDERSPNGTRHLRHRYKDPLTGEDFAELRDQLTQRIIGVASTSNKTPLKQTNFPDQYVGFEGKDKYSDWQFISTINIGITGTAPRTATPAAHPAAP